MDTSRDRARGLLLDAAAAAAAVAARHATHWAEAGCCGGSGAHKARACVCPLRLLGTGPGPRPPTHHARHRAAGSRTTRTLSAALLQFSRLRRLLGWPGGANCQHTHAHIPSDILMVLLLWPALCSAARPAHPPTPHTCHNLTPSSRPHHHPRPPSTSPRPPAAENLPGLLLWQGSEVHRRLRPHRRLDCVCCAAPISLTASASSSTLSLPQRSFPDEVPEAERRIRMRRKAALFKGLRDPSDLHALP